MPDPQCRKRKLSLGRRMTCDYLHAARGNHTAAVERLLCIPEVVAARRVASPRPSWGAIMVKAFAMAAWNHPQMRQAYFSFPWGHIGEYDSQVANVIIERQVGDESVLFLAPLYNPERKPLRVLDQHLKNYREEPVESFGIFRAAMAFARLPRFVRRLSWWFARNVSAKRRARHFGTFGVTTMSPFGAKTLVVPSLWSALLHYGIISETGEVPVGVAFDHRVMDGGVVGYTLLEMEQILRRGIVEELQGMRRAVAA